MSSISEYDALIVIAEGVEEIEFITVPDVLVRAGLRVLIASAEKSTNLRGSRGLPLAADVLLDEVIDQDFPLLYLPGGLPQAQFCQNDARIQALLQKRFLAQQLTAIICACPISLIPGDLAKGRKLTSHPSVADQLREAGAEWTGERVQRCGQLFTSQGPGTAAELAFALVKELLQDSEDVDAEALVEEIATGMLQPQM